MGTHLAASSVRYQLPFQFPEERYSVNILCVSSAFPDSWKHSSLFSFLLHPKRKRSWQDTYINFLSTANRTKPTVSSYHISYLILFQQEQKQSSLAGPTLTEVTLIQTLKLLWPSHLEQGCQRCGRLVVVQIAVIDVVKTIASADAESRSTQTRNSEPETLH